MKEFVGFLDWLENEAYDIGAAAFVEDILKGIKSKYLSMQKGREERIEKAIEEVFEKEGIYAYKYGNESASGEMFCCKKLIRQITEAIKQEDLL